MGTIGSVAVLVAIAAVIYTIVVSVLAARSSSPGRIKGAEYGTYVAAIALSLAVAVLQLALITGDFSLQYVGEYTSSTLSTFYRVGAMWAGQGGSLLLWAWLASLCAAWITYQNRVKNWEMSTYTTAAFAVVTGLFSGLVAFVSTPFAAATQITTDGMGLNPLLQDPLQIIHPLALYAGYVLYTIPMAIVVGALLAGETSGPWVKVANRWNVISWIALTAGIVLGARWAYAELGWGGYWAWDPVENASLLPWLTGTILLHTGMTYRGLPRLRLASVITVMTTFCLVLFGTFLTRSGVISSVHAFGESNMGVILGTAISLIVIGCGILVVWRLPQLRLRDPERRGHGWLGQLILLVLLVVITVAVLWGTLYPLFARLISGQEIAVTPGFFRVVITPLALLILLLFAVSPLLPGQHVDNRAREIVVRVLVAVVVFGGIMVLTHGANPGVAIVITLAVLSVLTVIHKARPRLRDAYDNDQSPIWGAIRASGPYVGHVGLVVLLSAVAINVAFQQQGQAKIALGKSATIAGQVITLDHVDVQEFPDRASFTATVTAAGDDGSVHGTVDSKLEQFTSAEQLHAQVGILSNAWRDIYVVVDEADATSGSEFAVLTVYDNPGVIWIWIGGSLLALGGILFAIPRRRRQDSMEEVTMSASDDDLAALLDAAIVAARTGKASSVEGDPVADLVSRAEELAKSKGDGTASQDDVVAFLEQARSRVTTEVVESPVLVVSAKQPSAKAAASPPAGSGAAGTGEKKPMGLYIVGAIVAVGALVIGAYVMGHQSGTAVPGFSGSPTTSSPSPSASPVDQAQVASLMQKITSNPKDYTSLLALGDIYFNAGDFKNATTFYSKATEADSTKDAAWVAYGASAYNTGDDKTALSAWQKAVALNPNNAEAHYGLGFLYLSEKPPQEAKAKAEWLEVVRIDPKSDLAKTVQQHLASLATASPSPSAS